MAIVMKGMDVVNARKEEMIRRVELLKNQGIRPCLGILRVGEKQEDISYERGALKRLLSVGIEGVVETMPWHVTQKELEDKLMCMNKEEGIHGILLFQPLPDHLSVETLKQQIDPKKDVDAMSTVNMGKIFIGDSSGFAPCTPESVLWMLDYYGIDLEGKNVTIVGRSSVVGKPLSILLLGRNATVTICHTKTVGLKAQCKDADILIVAAGKACMITRDMVNSKAVVVDVGIHVDNKGKLCGDVDYEKVSKVAAYCSPVPGGVGSITSSVLASHVLIAAEKQAKSKVL